MKGGTAVKDQEGNEGILKEGKNEINLEKCLGGK